MTFNLHTSLYMGAEYNTSMWDFIVILMQNSNVDFGQLSYMLHNSPAIPMRKWLNSEALILI